MYKSLAYLTAALILCTAGASAFDGNRRGFALGAGLGYAPVTVFDDNSANISEQDDAMAQLTLIGWGIDSRNVISFGGVWSGYNPERQDISGIEQGLVGLTWDHYFDSTAPSWFAGLMIGRFWSNVRHVQEERYGLGVSLSAGYEPVRHLRVGLYLYGSRTSDRGSSVYHGVLSVIVSATAF